MKRRLMNATSFLNGVPGGPSSLPDDFEVLEIRVLKRGWVNRGKPPTEKDFVQDVSSAEFDEIIAEMNEVYPQMLAADEATELPGANPRVELIHPDGRRSKYLALFEGEPSGADWPEEIQVGRIADKGGRKKRARRHH